MKALYLPTEGAPGIHYDAVTAPRIQARRVSSVALAVVVPALSVIALAGCTTERDPVPHTCPELAVGDLVLSEIRGSQSGSDTLGQWIEVYNASSSNLDLEGVRLRMVKLSGGGEAAILVRESTPIAAGGYAVLGDFDNDSAPVYVDYGYGTDFSSSFYDSAALELSSCGVVLDKLIYRGLPNTGTYSLDGAMTPSATGNDVDSAWCNDNEPDPTNTTSLGVPGTPQTANRPCPVAN